MVTFLHNARMRKIKAAFEPVLEQGNIECAGLIFSNRYMMASLARLEPNHPLLNESFRQNLNDWGKFKYTNTAGDHKSKMKATADAGGNYAIPEFATKTVGNKHGA